MRGATSTTSTVAGGVMNSKAMLYPEAKTSVFPSTRWGAISSSNTPGATSSGMSIITKSASTVACAMDSTAKPSERACLA
jgi:hypothetical protein